MKIKSLSLMFIAILALATAAFGQPLVPTSSFTRAYNFPPVGLASSETAQVNLVNEAPTPTAAGATAPACTGTVTFANASGKTIGTPATFTTTGSQVFSTQLTFSQLAATGTRGEFLASIQLTNGSLPPKAQCSLMMSLETFDDTTGATHVYVWNSATSAGALLPIGIR
jgi:hypothetical protein